MKSVAAILYLHLLGFALMFGPASFSVAAPAADEPFVREDISIYAAEPLPQEAELRSWIAAMKENPRGPFQRIRWFCNDGTVHPPKPYTCVERGGGVQHGEWTLRVKMLRAHGYFVANVLADIDPPTFTRQPSWERQLKQIFLEQFLIDADDGWIFRKARFYRGALQAENETANGRGILLEILANRHWIKRNYLVLRESVRFIPHGRHMAPLTEMRQMATAIAEKDPTFTNLRIKLHVRPDTSDAQTVLRHSQNRGKPDLAEEYRRLAALIVDVYRPRNIDVELKSVASRIKSRKLADTLREYAAFLAPQKPLEVRLEAATHALASIRKNLLIARTPPLKLYLLHLSLDLEQEVFGLTSQWLARMAMTSRQQRIQILQAATQALYGMGLLSARQVNELARSFSQLLTSNLSSTQYKEHLDYLGRVPGWAEDHLHLHFSETIAQLSRIEPRFNLYPADRMRGSPLTPFAAILDTLSTDANRLVGIRHKIFGLPVDSGLRPLNPGLARGTLRFLHAGEDPTRLAPKAIYVLPETTDDLPPIAGIITKGEGNILSHVQLLARNLGIPNVAIDRQRLSWLRPHEGQEVVLAVSPGGVVSLEMDGPQWDEMLARERQRPEFLIRPDLEKLDLGVQSFLLLNQVRAADSGRICGPKAANLGELKAHFPNLVPAGLVLPFGVFRNHLDRPIQPGGPSVFEWMRQQYAALEDIDDPQLRASATEGLLLRLRQWITATDPGEEFRQKLWGALFHTFGREGSYGVFVRSDTNVEDLPGFTGAGLNLTVPNVVGFENILKAIQRVWASPFMDRAHAWRQAYMETPEHVYASVLLMKSVAVHKSGVLATLDVASGRRNSFTVAVNEGIGGAVAGQRAEELLIDRFSAKVRLLAQASEPQKRILLRKGGLSSAEAQTPAAILSEEEIHVLKQMGENLPGTFPSLLDSQGRPIPADIEFGFVDGRFVLFQIRPFLQSEKARSSRYLARLDAGLGQGGQAVIDLQKIPLEAE